MSDGETREAPGAVRRLLEARELLCWLLRYVGPSWRALLLIVPLTAAEAVLSILAGFLVAPVVDLALNEGRALAAYRGPGLSDLSLDRLGGALGRWLDPSRTPQSDLILWLCGAIVLVQLAKEGLGFLASTLARRAHAEATGRLQGELHSSLLHLPLSSRSHLEDGQLQARLLNDARSATSGFDGIVSALAFSPLLLAFYGWLLFTTSLAAGLIVVTGGAAHLIVARLLGGRLRALTTANLETWSATSQFVHESLQNLRLIRTTSTEAQRDEAFQDVCERNVQSTIALARLRAAEAPSRQMVNTLIRVALILVVIREYLSGHLGAMGCGLLLYAGNGIAQPIAQLASLGPRLVGVLTAADRVREVVREARPPRVGGHAVDRFERSIVFEGVGFHHEAGGFALEGVDLRVNRGERLALVGRNGAGKSTVLDLILGLLEPQKGRILVDGAPLSELDLRSYRRLFGVVPQSVGLLAGTLRDNVTYGHADAADAEVHRALEQAALEDLVRSLPDGLATWLGRSSQLSGGERQRVALARALLGRPRLLLLDEATTALDAITAATVERAITSIPDLTCVFVAHHPETIRRADRIVVLDLGRIVDAGTHEELHERCELYRELMAEHIVAVDGPRPGESTAAPVESGR